MRQLIFLLLLLFPFISMAQTVVILNVNQPPEFGFEITNQESIIIKGDSIELASDLQVFGGSGNYTFNWSHGITLSDSTILHAVSKPSVSTNFILTVTDQNGCSFSVDYFVNVVDSLKVSFEKNDATCFNGDDASILLHVSGGIKPYSFSWNNGSINSEIRGIQAGMYQVTVTDSINQTFVGNFEISEFPEIKTNINYSICDGGSVSIGDNNYSSSGQYSDTLTSVIGCDSIINLSLIVYPVYRDTSYASICEGSTYVFRNGIYNKSGFYPDTLISSPGCDSILTLSLNVNPIYNDTYHASICEGDFYSFGNEFYEKSGLYTDSLLSVLGCDSITTLSLTVNSIFVDTVRTSICEGEVFAFRDKMYNTSGSYTDTITSQTECDSILTLSLNVNPIYNDTYHASICEGDFYSFGNEIYEKSGLYTDSLLSVLGCDSITTLILLINPIFSDSTKVSICDGGIYNFRDNSYSEAGIYSDTLISSLWGCDSILVLQLEVFPLPIKPNISIIGDTLTSSNDQNQWYRNGTVIEGATQQKYIIENSAEYWVVSNNDNGCFISSDTVSLIYSDILMIKESSFECILFPNPNDGKFKVQLSGEPQKKIELTVIDNTGRFIKYKTIKNFKGEHTEFLELSLPNGIYTLLINTDEQRIHRQFIIK